MVVAVVEVLNHIYRKYSEVFRFTKKFCNDAKKSPLRMQRALFCGDKESATQTLIFK